MGLVRRRRNRRCLQNALADDLRLLSDHERVTAGDDPGHTCPTFASLDAEWLLENALEADFLLGDALITREGAAAGILCVAWWIVQASEQALTGDSEAGRAHADRFVPLPESVRRTFLPDEVVPDARECYLRTYEVVTGLTGVLPAPVWEEQSEWVVSDIVLHGGGPFGNAACAFHPAKPVLKPDDAEAERLLGRAAVEAAKANGIDVPELVGGMLDIEHLDTGREAAGIPKGDTRYVPEEAALRLCRMEVADAAGLPAVAEYDRLQTARSSGERAAILEAEAAFDHVVGVQIDSRGLGPLVDGLRSLFFGEVIE